MALFKCSKVVVTLSTANEAKDREIELLQEKAEESDYDELSDETHHTRQHLYKKENISLTSSVEELRKVAVQTQDDLNAMIRSCDEAEYEVQRLRKIIHKCECTFYIDLTAYKGQLRRHEDNYDDVRVQLDEANDEIVITGRERGSAILDLRLNGDLAETESGTSKAGAERAPI